MIILDTETTGLLNALATPLERQPRIIEFAAIKLDDKTFEQISAMTFLCNPGFPLEPKITRITSITDEMLKNEKPFSFYYDDLLRFFSDDITMIAHNAAFDYLMLKNEIKRLGKEDEFPMPTKIICTVERSKRLLGRRLKLSDMYELLCKKKIKEAHRAMNDTQALAECVIKLFKGRS